jgi:hypothetical protein
VDDPRHPDEPLHGTERGPQRADEEAMAHRVTRGASAGVVLGAVLLGGVGLIVGVTVFDGVPAIAASTLAGAIAGGGLGAYVGGLSRLESPDPGREPSETEHPLRDPGGLTKEE